MSSQLCVKFTQNFEPIHRKIWIFTVSYFCDIFELWRHKPYWDGSQVVHILHCEKKGSFILHIQYHAWWRHQMETFSALLAICAGNSPVPVKSPHKGQWRGALMFSLICVWINGWVNNHDAGDLSRHRGHYDVNVMGSWWLSSVRAQGIRRHGIGLVIPEYSGFSTRRINTSRVKVTMNDPDWTGTVNGFYKRNSKEILSCHDWIQSGD